MDDGGSPFQNVGKKFQKLFQKRNSSLLEEVTEEEIMSMVNEGHEKGVIPENEAQMISNIFDLDDKVARDIMVHRKSVVAIDGAEKLRDVIHFIEGEGFSRYPIYLDDMDNIIGIIHIKDILSHILKENELDIPVAQIPGLVRQCLFIPETRNISDLFKNMQSQKMHMVIVVDEYGQTAGVVAMEDILEEIVGNIQDEHDLEPLQIIPQKDGSFVIDGMAKLNDVCEALGIDGTEMEDYDTLNGFLVSEIDRIPSDGDQFSVDSYGYHFAVLLVENRMIRTVRATKAEHAL